MDKGLEDKYVIIIAALIQFMATFIGTMVTVVLPDIGAELNLNVSMLGWISLSFLLVIISISVPLGKVMTQYGIKRFSIFNIVLLIVGLLMSAVSFEADLLLISRIVQGIAVSTLLISIYILLVHHISKDKIGSALGIVGSLGYVGMTISPLISGFIAIYSWRYIFLLCIPICFVVLVLVLKLDEEWVGEKHPVNVSGSILYILSMVLFVVGLNNLDEWGIVLIIVSIFLVFVLFKSEHKKENAILNTKLLKNFKLLIADYAAFVSYFITFIATYLANIYLQSFLGFDTLKAGLILFTTPAIMVVVSVFAGRLSDRHDSRLLSGIAMLILSGVMVLFYFVDEFPFYGVILILALQGLAHGMFSPPNNKYALTIVEDDDLSDSTAILTTSKEFGKSCSIAIFTVIFSIFVNDDVSMFDVINDFVIAYNIMMIVSILLALSAAVLLFYSKYKFKEEINLEILSFIKSLNPFKK